MRNPCARILICVACCGAFFVIALAMQKPATKPNDWAMNNASIGTVEIAAGTSRQMQAMYPTPDGPSFPLKASVTWSLERPVKEFQLTSREC